MQNNHNNNAAMGPPGKVNITAAAFAAKYKVSVFNLSNADHLYLTVE